MEEKIYLAALHRLGISQRYLKIIFENQSNYKSFYTNLSHERLKEYIIDDKKIREILENKTQVNLEELEKTIKKLNISLLVIHEEEYPDSLRHIYNPPYLLYLRWEIPKPWIAIVGSRKMTSYWKQIIESIVPKLWRYFAIISGWAAGCDTEAHKEALNNDIKTLAIVGTGIDKCYPAENKKLFEKIISSWWWILSIFPLGEVWYPTNFPIRNEIVAGLSSWIVIVEAKDRSGSLITARLWLELGREVFAFPWDIYKDSSAGTNKLIVKWEAKFTLNADDILQEFNIVIEEENMKPKIIFNDKEEKTIYELIVHEPLSIDEISTKLNYDISFLLLKVSMLELWGYIRKSDNARYTIV